MSNHTPGPWEIEMGHEMRNGATYWQVHDGSDAICQNQFCSALNSQENGRLIAAAPELLSALALCLSALETASRQLTEEHRLVLNGKVWGDTAINTAILVIAKATGEE